MIYMVDIREAKTQDEIIRNVELFRQIPRIKENWQTMFSNCILGKYRTFFGYEDNIAVLVVFFSTGIKGKDKKNAHICGVFGKKKVHLFIDQFYNQLKSEGYTSMSAYSMIPEKSFEKFSGFKKSYSVYHKKL